MPAKQTLKATVAMVVLMTPASARAALSFNVAASGWPNAAHRDAAVAAIQSAVNRYNAYGDFGNYNIHVYYNAGIPTAQANYLGSIGFGGTYPNERVMMHEVAHYLGSGTFGDPWDGARGEALIDQFDGVEATLQGDSAHFWPYGLNFDSEGAEINRQRHVAVLYAQRADMGIGSTANPWSATTVNLTASDALGESGFNYATTWSDNRFAHAGATYSTGNFILRTPASASSFTFAGDSLTVNNANGANGGLLYKGTGTTGVMSFKNLVLSGGYVRHASGAGDLFRLGGKVTLAGSSTIDAAQGNINVSANVGGSGSLTKTGGFTLILADGNTYEGDTTISGGTLRLAPSAPVASYTFDSVGRNTVVNTGTGGPAMNGVLAGGASIVAGGHTGNAASLAGGASVDINSPIVDLNNTSSWTISAWVKTATPGASILTKGDGAGWAYGNTIFYLGDGTGPGSGGIPSGVRWAGGFFQGSTAATPVNDNTWHKVTYVNTAGNFAIYVDGVAQPLSPGNSSFAVPDVGNVVRLGVSTNTFPADGTVNFNGLLDDVEFYNQALSAAQIAALYQGQSISPLPATTNVSIAAGATLDVNGMTQQIGSLSGPAGAAVLLGAGKLIVDSGSSTQFAGTLSGTGGSLVKAGPGTLALEGANSYTGTTTINGGTLLINNTSGSGTGPGAVLVDAGGTLGGTGTVAGMVTLNGGGHIAPGASIESLDVGSLTLTAGSVLDFELDTIAGADSSDLINVTSNNGLTIEAGVLNLTNLGNMTEGTYKLIDYVGTLNGNVNSISLGIVPDAFTYDLINNTLNTSIELVVAPALELLGDFNDDGIVDAADYVVWRHNEGQPAGTLPNDNTGVAIGSQQYTLWQSNFGRTSGGASTLAASAVPEPGNWLSALVAAAATLLCRIRSGRQRTSQAVPAAISPHKRLSQLVCSFRLPVSSRPPAPAASGVNRLDTKTLSI